VQRYKKIFNFAKKEEKNLHISFFFTNFAAESEKNTINLIKITYL